MNDPILDIPQELDPSFHSWKTGEPGFACHADVEGIGGFEGESLWVGVGGGKYEQKGRALASRSQLRNLCVDGRNIPQPLIDAVVSLLEEGKASIRCLTLGGTASVNQANAGAAETAGLRSMVLSHQSRKMETIQRVWASSPLRGSEDR